MRTKDYIAHETERQSGTFAEAAGMAFAYDHMVVVVNHRNEITELDIKILSNEITGNSDYRLVPAVFNQGMPALPAQQIPVAMTGLIGAINRFGSRSEDWARVMTREFLLIHPFADGNGRVASLLWNYMNRTLLNPEPMPYFFGPHNG